MSVSFLGRHSSIRSSGKFKHGSFMNIGNFVVIDCNSVNGVTFGDRVTIRDFSKIDCQSVVGISSDGLLIGNNVGISEHAFIQVRGKVVIGNDVIIGPRVTILSEEHNHSDRTTATRLQGVTRKYTNIGANVWIGAGATLLGGVQVGDGAIIAAGAVVRDNVRPYTIVAGVPAQFKKERKNNEH